MFVFRLCVALLAALALAGPALADPVLVEGTLVDASGAPAAGTVEAYLGGDVGPDGTATLEPLATAIAAADGRFSLSLAPTQELVDAAAANGGYLNVDLVGESGADVYYQAIVRRYEGGAWLDGDGAKPRDAALAPAGPRAPRGATICILRKTLVGAERRHTAIGELHNASDVAFSRLTYGRRADSEISVGFSATGASWSLRGSYHVGNLENSAQTTPIASDDWGHRLLTDFSFGKYRYVNTCGGQWYTVKPRFWVPGRYIGADNSELDHHCLDRHAAYASHFGAYDSFARSTNRYWRFAAAAVVGLGTGGLELNAQSGLSTWVDVLWKFGGAPHHYLCGNDGPISTSHRIFAGA